MDDRLSKREHKFIKKQTSHVRRVSVTDRWRETSRVLKIVRVFVRDFTALSVIIVGSVLVVLLNLRVDAADDSFVARVFGTGGVEYMKPVSAPAVSRSLALVPVSSAPVRDSVKNNNVSVDSYAMAYAAPYGSDIALDDDPGDIDIYTVQKGDTIGGIAQSHGVTIDTILWANEIDDVSTIKPGDTIILLATNGVQHKITKNDTVASIAKKYKSSEKSIISYNGLPANGEIVVGEKIIIPDGIKEEIVKPKATIARRSYTSIGVAKQVAVSRSYYGRPVTSYRRTQGLHRTNAIDMAAPIGTPIYAAAAGTVVISRSGWNGGYGNYIVIAHPNGTKTLYAHNSKLYTKVGKSVKKGQKIAAMGSTGRSTGSHLHFEVRGARNPF